MAYGVKYRFKFESVDGVEWTIDILKDGYSGSVLLRALGGSPVLRRDQSDNVFGTSLDLVAECAVDGEFEEFSQSAPHAFMAKLYKGNALKWQGYVTPEMYSAPDIAPPYDVRITCTDGLGELKLNSFAPQGTVSIVGLLDYLLAFTGLSLNILQITDLKAAGSSSPGMTIQDVFVNLDYLEGETCYDVLQTLLASLHMTVTLDGDTWLLVKETGLTVGANGVTAYSGPTTYIRSVSHFGSVEDHSGGYWPVGHMSREYVPAKKRILLSSDNHYRPDLLGGAWSLSGGASQEDSYIDLPLGGEMTKYVTFDVEVRKHLMMSIKVRNIGSGTTEGKITVMVKLTGHSYGGTTWYLVNGTANRRKEETDVTWASSSGVCTFDVQAPLESDTDQDYITVDVQIPLYYNSARYYMGATRLDVAILNNGADGIYDKRVYGVDLYQYEQMTGYRKEVLINNGARGEAPDVDLAFACIAGLNDYAGLEQLQYGVPMDSDGERIASWSTGAFSDKEYLELMGRDYALSVAAPRVRLKGVLNTPETGGEMPVVFVDDFDDVAYLVETFSWDLRNDEMTVQMISLPSASITVSDESLEPGESGNPTGHTQGSPSSGGGGGGGTGTVTSVALSIPTYFDISGSPVTGSGTLTATLKSSYKIPSSSEWSNVYDKAHTHSNKSILDTISQSELTAWDNAADKAHTHSNKSVLDQISQNDLTNWDAAYNYMSTLDINSSDIQHWDAAYAAMHSHSNKSVLDGISSADVTSWDGAATNSHTHSNKAVLDTISSSDVSAWDGAATNSHTHANKSVLDLIDQGYIDSINGAISDAHVHSNWSTLDNITATQVSHWDTAYTNNHTHSNKSVLDGITSAKVSAWDAAALGDSIDISIGGTAAAPTVAVALGTGASDYVALPIAGSSLAGIVTNGAQTIAGAKTFSDYIYLSRIYLGASGSSGAYIEWDNSAHAFKVVGDIYATGDVAAGDD